MNLLTLEIIEAIAPDPNLLMWKFSDSDKEIKNGAKLTVRESQTVMFINEGQLADIFTPGLYTIDTENIPVLSRLRGWKYGFKSPFKADIYFFNTHQFLNLKWGTPAPIIMRDSHFGQVRIRAFGAYNVRIKDVATFFRQYAGTYPILTIFELERQLRDFVAPKFGEILSRSGFSVMDIAGNITELSNKIQPLLQPLFDELGLELTKFQITSATLPDEVTEYFDKMTNMNMVTNMDKYHQFNIANAIGQEGMAMNQATNTVAMMGAIVGEVVRNNNQQALNAVATEDNITDKLKKIKSLFESGLIDEGEYKAKKTEILKDL